MRTLRLSLVWTVILALLAGVLVSAIAQDDGSGLAEGDYVFVTGVEENVVGGGGSYTGKDVVSDPRVSGDVDIAFDLGCSGDTTCWMGGDVSITNDGGVWDGERVGFINAGGVHDLMEWFNGSGDYKGWSYIAFLSGLDNSSSMDVRGILYRGDLPPSVAEELAAPSAE